jgi:hypothetical protein
MVQEVYARSPCIKTVFGTQQVRLTLTNDAWKKFHVIVEDLINEKQWHYSYITRRAAQKRYTATVAELQSYVFDSHGGRAGAAQDAAPPKAV